MERQRTAKRKRTGQPAHVAIDGSVGRAVGKLKPAKAAKRLPDYPLAQAFGWTPEGKRRAWWVK